VSDINPLKGRSSLDNLDLKRSQVNDLSPIQHLIDAGLQVHGP